MATASKVTGVKVGLLDIAFLNTEENLKNAYNLIPEHRVKKAEALKKQEDKQRCVASAILLNTMINNAGKLNDDIINVIDGNEALRNYNKQYNYEVAYKKNGKPYFAQVKDLFYNISHTKNTVVCAVSDKEVGIDIEAMREPIINVAKRFYSEMENKWIEEALSFSEAKERAIRLWTLKEAYSKLTGEGIALGMKEACFDIKSGVPYKHNLEIKELKYKAYYISVIKNL